MAQSDKDDLISLIEEDGGSDEIPTSLPLLPVRDIVIFSDMVLPLFVGREKRRAAGQTDSSPAAPPRRRTFAEFVDPFASGASEGVSADELIGYSFEAFEAWSGDLGFRRRPQQTAHEFVEVVGERLPAIAREAEALAELVSWSRFANDPVPRSKLKHLERLWRRMRRAGPAESLAPEGARQDRPSV